MVNKNVFDVIALDKDFNVASLVTYSNLQWSRKYHEAGTFSVSVLMSQYSSDWKYIYTKDRPEVGKITQVNYLTQGSMAMIVLSGYFLEKELDDMVVYPLPTTFAIEGQESEYYADSILTGQADWIGWRDTADVVAHKFFNAFKSIRFQNYEITNREKQNIQQVVKEFGLDILDGTTDTQHGEYKIADHNRNGEQLGWKCYSILKPSGASYRVRLDYLNSVKYFDVIHGRDLRDINEAGNNPVVFSSVYGNIRNVNIVKSVTDTKDAVVQYVTDSSEPQPSIVLVNAEPDAKGRFLAQSIARTYSQYNDNTFKYDAMHDAGNALADHEDVLNISFEASVGSYEYMTDFDIGDLVSIEIPEMDISADARLIGCYEVINKSNWSMSLEFGTPILRR